MPGEWKDDELGGGRPEPSVGALVVRGMAIIGVAVVSAFWILIMHMPAGH